MKQYREVHGAIQRSTWSNTEKYMEQYREVHGAIQKDIKKRTFLRWKFMFFSSKLPSSFHLQKFMTHLSTTHPYLPLPSTAHPSPTHPSLTLSSITHPSITHSSIIHPSIIHSSINSCSAHLNEAFCMLMTSSVRGRKSILSCKGR